MKLARDSDVGTIRMIRVIITVKQRINKPDESVRPLLISRVFSPKDNKRIKYNVL